MSISDEDRNALVAWMHSRQLFEYDSCDHGTYTGGAMAGEPYAMCERWADALMASNILATIQADALDAAAYELEEFHWDYLGGTVVRERATAVREGRRP